MSRDQKEDSERYQRRRLKGFGFHLIGYFIAMLVIVPWNMTQTPGNPWFLFPMIGWGSVLALHAAYAMGLFAVFRKKNDE